MSLLKRFRLRLTVGEWLEATIYCFCVWLLAAFVFPPFEKHIPVHGINFVIKIIASVLVTWLSAVTVISIHEWAYEIKIFKHRKLTWITQVGWAMMVASMEVAWLGHVFYGAPPPFWIQVIVMPLFAVSLVMILVAMVAESITKNIQVLSK